MEDSPFKPSVAELAGRFKGHILPLPSAHDKLPFRRKPPCSLQFPNQKNDADESDKNTVSTSPVQIGMRSSSIIERLQANLALSPTTLLPSPKSAADVNRQPESPSPPSTTSPTWGPRSPTLQPVQVSVEEEEPVNFDSPPEGTPLPSFNKTRARLSFKRRPPTRQHRRSAGEEAGLLGSNLSPCELQPPEANGDRVFECTQEEDDEHHHMVKEGEEEEEEEEEEDCEEQANALPEGEVEVPGEEEWPLELDPAQSTENNFHTSEGDPALLH
ncbi:capZ-interacting protein [Dunckerocampus dactyliophorus]|uniref:capZ-interacting protein n=1 Tax=Dunckerocampus dactyliophorus TaxID=161453 RepID=UPI00240528A5|nr:capZ-interacting protein [Dunckerocampus dactyliophorus]